MPENPPLFRVFVSSPGDVPEERQAVLEVVEGLPNRPLLREKVNFRVVAWDKPGAGTAMPANMSPQEAINAGLPKPSECQIVVVILWSRMGTPYSDNGVDYLSGTHYELLDALNNPQTFTLIYRRDEEKLFKASDDEGIAQYKNVQNFFDSELFKNPAIRQIRRSVKKYVSPAEFKKQFETDLEDIVKRLLEQPPVPTSASEPPTFTSTVWEGSPFPGLRAFRRSDTPIFFGRETETDALVKRVKESRFVAVVGASGSGKSSLVGAGLLPRLAANAISDAATGSKDWLLPDYEKGKGWSGLRFTPGELGNDPFLALAAKLAPLLDEEPNPLAQKLAQSPEEAINQLLGALAGKPVWAEVLLFIDQFEELFTLSQKYKIEPFIQMLSVLAEHPRLRVVVTIRHDFVTRAIENPILAELLNKGTFYLSAPTPSALSQMIERPAEMAALEFERGLPALILYDTGSEAGSLALLAYLLDELYKIAVKRGDKRLFFSDYEKLGEPEEGIEKRTEVTATDGFMRLARGGVAGAIGKRAEETFRSISGTAEEKERLLGQVFRELVTVEEVKGQFAATRQRVRHDCFGVEELALVEAFTKARLLVMDKAQVEVAHEELFRSWEQLKKWIEDYRNDLILRRQVQSAAAEWVRKGKPDTWRWSQERLLLVYAMQERLKWKPNPLEEDFIEPEQERLLREVNLLGTSHSRRRDIGDRLSDIRDTRQGTGAQEDGTPEIAWLSVAPGGEIKIKEETFKVEPFYIGQYQITYEHYEVFVKAEDGYNNPVWWQGFPKEYQPKKLNEQRTKAWNNPRDRVNWYQAVAYGRWLNKRMRGLELGYPGNPQGKPFVVGGNVEIRLPTEWEWQWAAQGGTEARRYPWGDWQAGYANTSEAGLSRAVGVGLYPQGVAKCGALDMSGNVEEWCLNKAVKTKEVVADVSNDNRVLRGGSFGNSLVSATCASRHSVKPVFDFNLFGFRLVVSFPITGL